MSQWNPGGTPDPNDPSQRQPPFGQPPPYSQPGGYPAAPQYGYGGPPPQQGGTNVLAIVSIVLAFLCSIAGLVCGIIAINQSKSRGQSPTLAIIGTVLSAVFMVVGGIFYAVR